jgi:hypothetical protein
MRDYVLDEDDDDLDDGDDDDFENEDEDGEDDDEDEEEVETWQVVSGGLPLKVRPFLTSGVELPRLARISSSTGLGSDSAGFASRRRFHVCRRPHSAELPWDIPGGSEREGFGLCQPGQSHGS